MVPFKYSLPVAVSLLSPEDGSSVIEHVRFQITTEKKSDFLWYLFLFTHQVMSQKVVTSKGNSRSGVDPPSSGLTAALLLQSVPSQTLHY